MREVRTNNPAPTTSTLEGNADFAIAVQRCCAVIGIAADPDRQLPRDLMRLAEHRIIVPPLDAPAVATVIEAVTGRHPGALDGKLVRHVTLETLTIAVSNREAHHDNGIAMSKAASDKITPSISVC
jgi:hypothetical protein